ncbi:MAG: hypothetical protein WD360_04380 [Nitriliruptoraceae bacterium]
MKVPAGCRCQSSAGSAALLYPGVIVFVLLLAALVFDTFTMVSHERHLAHFTQALGRHTLTHFDRDIYRATGTIVVNNEITDVIVATAVAQINATGRFDTANCVLDSGINEVHVNCQATLKRGVFPLRPHTQITVRRLLVAEQHCAACARQVVNDG